MTVFDNDNLISLSSRGNFKDDFFFFFFFFSLMNRVTFGIREEGYEEDEREMTFWDVPRGRRETRR